MKLLNDLRLQFEKELWALNPELAVIDTILSNYPEIIEMMKQEVTGVQEGSVYTDSILVSRHSSGCRLHAVAEL